VGFLEKHSSATQVWANLTARRYDKSLELPADIRFHDLRHTVDTHALRRGRPIHEVSKMLGHADPAMTLRRYAHVLDDMRDATARAMDELFKTSRIKCLTPHRTPTDPNTPTSTDNIQEGLVEKLHPGTAFDSLPLPGTPWPA
jgi:hypothetical protein